MTHLPKLLVILSILTITFNGSSQILNSSEYYYNFIVEIENITQKERLNVKSNFSKKEFFQLEEGCSMNGKILISVNVKYEKRVPVIEMEIEELLESSISKSRIKSIQKVSTPAKIELCK